VSSTVGSAFTLLCVHAIQAGQLTSQDHFMSELGIMQGLHHTALRTLCGTFVALQTLLQFCLLGACSGYSCILPGLVTTTVEGTPWWFQ
jgi:hypothetical protein